MKHMDIEKIERLMDEKGISRAGIASAVRVSLRTVNRWFSGTSLERFHLVNLFRIARALEVHVKELVKDG